MSAGREPFPVGIEEILALFRGRRRSRRTDCRRPIDVTGATGTYRGRTINASRLGALIEIEDEAFSPAGAEASLMDVAHIVRGLFPSGMTIRFRRAGVSVGALVVRVAQHPTRLDSVIGCEFLTPLSRRQCRAIGIVPDSRGETSEKPPARSPAPVAAQASPARPTRAKR